MKKEIIKKLILALVACLLFGILMQIPGGGWLLVIVKMLLAALLFYLLIGVSGNGEE